MKQSLPTVGPADAGSSVVVIATVAQQKARLVLADPMLMDAVPEHMRIEPASQDIATVKHVWARPRATKTNCLDGGKLKLADYNAGSEFYFSENRVTSLEAVAQLLQDQAADARHGSFVVIGELTESARNHPRKRQRRRSDVRKYGQDGVTLVAGPSRLLILDLDDAQVPDWDPLSPAPGINWICSKLGAAYEHADVLVQITGSQSITPGALARVRLYFFLSESWSLLEHRCLVNELKTAHPSLKLDAATTVLGQPIYIAPPLCVGERSAQALYDPWTFRIVDPIPTRWLLLKRSGVLLQEKPPQQVAYTYLPSGRLGHSAGLVMIKSREPGYELEALLDHEDQIHSKILDATFNMARHHRELRTAEVVESVQAGLVRLCIDGALAHRADRIYGGEIESEIGRAYVSAWARLHGRRVDAPALAQLSAQEGVQAVADAVSEFFAGQADRLAIQATMGLGKSEAVLRHAVALQARVDLFVPDLALASEMAVKIQNLGSMAVVIRGRTATVDPSRARDSDAERMCLKWQTIETVQQIADGHVGADQLCRRSLGRGQDHVHCPHYNECAYVAQFRQAPESVQFVIRAHDYLCYEPGHLDEILNRRIGPAGFNVIDEDPLSRLIAHSTYDLGRLRVEAEREGFFFERPLNGILDALSRGQDAVAGFLTAMVGRPQLEGDDHEEWKQAQDAIRELVTHVGGAPHWFDPALSARDALQRAQAGLRVNLWRKILQEVQETLGARQCKTNRIWTDRRDGTLIVQVAKANPAIRVASRRVPLLLLDGSADLLGLRQVFGEMEVRRVDVRRQARVVQVVDRTFSDTALRANSARISDLTALAQLLRGTNSPGVVARKSIEPLFSAVGIPTLHHGKLRGQNVLAHCDVLLVVGRMQPPPVAMEEQARALYPYDALNLAGSYQRGPGSYRLNSAEIQEVQDRQWTHPDPRVTARLQQFRENELAQAIDRARLVHAQARKTVLLFTNQPVNLDLEVELVPLIDVLGPEGLLELMAANGGLLPLNWRWLRSQHPERFPTEARAKDFAQRAKSWAERNPLGLALLEADCQPGARGRAGHAVRWLGVSSQVVNDQEAKKEGSLNESY